MAAKESDDLAGLREALESSGYKVCVLQNAGRAQIGTEEFEHFVQNLFTRMGFETHKLKAGGDGGVDVLDHDHDPVRGAKYVIQAKKYTHKVAQKTRRATRFVCSANTVIRGWSPA